MLNMLRFHQQAKENRNKNLPILFGKKNKSIILWCPRPWQSLNWKTQGLAQSLFILSNSSSSSSTRIMQQCCLSLEMFLSLVQLLLVWHSLTFVHPHLWVRQSLTWLTRMVPAKTFLGKGVHFQWKEDSPTSVYCCALWCNYLPGQNVLG